MGSSVVKSRVSEVYKYLIIHRVRVVGRVRRCMVGRGLTTSGREGLVGWERVVSVALQRIGEELFLSLSSASGKSCVGLLEGKVLGMSLGTVDGSMEGIILGVELGLYEGTHVGFLDG